MNVAVHLTPMSWRLVSAGWPDQAGFDKPFRWLVDAMRNYSASRLAITRLKQGVKNN